MKEKPRGHKFNIIPQLSLRKRFMLGIGLMLMPFFLLAGSSLMLFELAIVSFDRAENENLEERFPLAELKSDLSLAKYTIDKLLEDPSNNQHREQLQSLDTNINTQIESMLSSKSSLAERRQLLIAVSNSWKSVYEDTMQYPQNLEVVDLGVNDRGPTASTIINQIRNELRETRQIIDTIESKLANFQSYDNLKRARQLMQSQRLLVACIALTAISIALTSAFFLSRSVLQSMQVLIKGLEALSEGALDQRIECNDSGEFGRLASAINRMAEKLSQNQKALIESATIDHLTGILNRREFNRLLSIEIERSRRNDQPVSVIMIDIDHFKRINDTYGHQGGDDALQWVSSVLQSEVRPGDMVSRYGGEEFALILPNADTENASGVAERIRQKLSSEPVQLMTGQLISLTASLGHATFPHVGKSEESLINAADRALYQAKDRGRNQVCLAIEDPAQSDIELYQKVSA